MNKRIFTLKESMDLLPQVQELTAEAVARAERLLRRIESTPEGPRCRELEAEYNTVVRNWAERVIDLGAEVKGLWLVDFDSGDGIYYCWRYPEPALDYFHDYDAGFAGRRPLGALKVT
ncbi:MAG: DUF2203 domain-containing protein [Candidatus Krumholzibacteriia bacterium]